MKHEVKQVLTTYNVFLPTAVAKVTIYSDANDEEHHCFSLISVWAEIQLFWCFFLFGSSGSGLEEGAGSLIPVWLSLKTSRIGIQRLFGPHKKVLTALHTLKRPHRERVSFEDPTWIWRLSIKEIWSVNFYFNRFSENLKLQYRLSCFSQKINENIFWSNIHRVCH